MNKVQKETHAKIKKAFEHLQSGDTKKAEKLFDEIYDKNTEVQALVAYHHGQLAERRIDYAKAMLKYREAATLEPDNPDYLLSAGKIARTLGSYKEAQEWLESLLQLRQQEGDDTVELATAQYELAELYRRQDKYEKAELLYKRSLAIREKFLGKDHPDVAAILNNLANVYSE